MNTTDPDGASPAAIVAVSLTPFPSTTPEDAWVVIVGAAFVTTTDSFAALHAPATKPLFESPL